MISQSPMVSSDSRKSVDFHSCGFHFLTAVGDAYVCFKSILDMKGKLTAGGCLGPCPDT